MRKKLLFDISICTCILFLISFCAPIEYEDDERNRNYYKVKPEAQKGIKFDFEGEPQSGGFNYKIPLAGGEEYNINQPFKKLMREWCEKNFVEINDNSLDEINVEIKDLDYDGGMNSFLKSIYMKVNISGNIGDSFFDKDLELSRSFSRSSSADPNLKGNIISNKAKTNINRFVMDMVSKIDNYLRNNVKSL